MYPPCKVATKETTLSLLNCGLVQHGRNVSYMLESIPSSSVVPDLYTTQLNTLDIDGRWTVTSP